MLYHAVAKPLLVPPVAVAVTLVIVGDDDELLTSP